MVDYDDIVLNSRINSEISKTDTSSIVHYSDYTDILRTAVRILKSKLIMCFNVDIDINEEILLKSWKSGKEQRIKVLNNIEKLDYPWNMIYNYMMFESASVLFDINTYGQLYNVWTLEFNIVFIQESLLCKYPESDGKRTFNMVYNSFNKDWRCQ